MKRDLVARFGSSSLSFNTLNTADLLTATLGRNTTHYTAESGESSIASPSSDEPRSPDATYIRNLPIEVLLRHTALPSDRDIIEKLASSTQQELADHQAQIDKLTASLTLLEHKRDKLKKKLSQYRSLLSPVHRLPPEILQNIFTMFNDLPEEERWLRPSEMAPVLAVSGTCGRWRDIALSTPPIWSSIAIRFEKRWDDQEYHRMNLLTQLFVHHSQKSPLKLILHFDKLLSLYDEVVGLDVIPVLKTLVQHSKRWHTVEFRFITQAVMAHQVFMPITGRLPILTNLRLFGQGGSPDFHCDLFRDCPALTSLSYEPAGPLTAHCPLPWGQIKSLQIENALPNSMISTASLCPNLKRLAIRWCGGRTYTGDPSLASCVPHLVPWSPKDSGPGLLCFSNYPHVFGRTVLLKNSPCISRTMTRKKLRTFAWKDWDEGPIVDFFRRSSGCSITSLSLKYVPISDKQLIQFLRFKPAPSSLTLEESSRPRSTRSITQRFLLRLTFCDKEASPVPSRSCGYWTRSP
ncbi:hypothetical protein MPER_12708 [Moniliophthora perniciosa FA553]|nr:hypothetical protein MPER_12708 [Moniliophthora perniciosa FA553]